MKKANVEEIWRKHGWIPPSKEDPKVIERQASSRKEVVTTSDEQTPDKEQPSEQN